MSKNTKPEPMIPVQIKMKEDTRIKLKRIAQANGLSLNDVATMCLAAGLPTVENKLHEIHNPAPELAAA